MKKCLFSLFSFLTVFFLQAQDYNDIQQKIGFLFADLPLLNSSELWLNQIQLRKEKFTDTTIERNNNNIRLFIIRDITSYSTIAPQVDQALLTLFNAPLKRKDKEVIDTAMGIHVLLKMRPGISIKAAKKNYKNISNILIKTFEYSHLLFTGKSHFQCVAYSNMKYDAISPVQSSFGLDKESNTYFINLIFQKMKNAGSL